MRARCPLTARPGFDSIVPTPRFVARLPCDDLLGASQMSLRPNGFQGCPRPLFVLIGTSADTLEANVATTDNKQETLADKWLRGFRNNPIIAGLIVISLAATGIAGFTGSLARLIEMAWPATYDRQFDAAKKLMASGDPKQEMEGISALPELAEAHPLKRQELIDSLSKFLIKRFPQDKAIAAQYRPVLAHAIGTLTHLPRKDKNDHPLNIDIRQIRLEGLDLPNTNFEGVVLWGGRFIDVNFSRSTFRNADLGGTQFVQCSLEYADLADARLTGSYEDEENGHSRPTRFIATRLYGSTIDKARMDNCELVGITDFPIDKLKQCTAR
jgi:hypothetical protein